MPNRLNPILLNHQNYRLITICTFAIIIGVFDFMVFWFNANTIILVLFDPKQTNLNPAIYLLTILAFGYLARPMGGFFLGRYGDKKGRKPAIIISLWLMAITSLITTILPTFAQISVVAGIIFALLRIAQGIAFAPLLPVLWTLVYEKLPKNHSGLGAGILSSGMILGVLALFCVSEFLQNTLTPTQMITFGWRIPFAIGTIGSVFALFFAKKLQESPTFATQLTTPSLALTPKKILRSLAIVLAMSWFASAVFVVLVVLLKDLTALSFFVDDGVLSVSYFLMLLFFAIGAVFFGFLTDRINGGVVYMISSVLLMLSVVGLFYDLRHGGQMMLLTFVLTGFFAGIIGATPVAMARFCPPNHRLVLFGTGYNLVQALTGLGTPFIMGFLSFYNDFAPAVYLCLVLIFMVFMGFYLYDNPRQKEQHTPS